MIWDVFAINPLIFIGDFSFLSCNLQTSFSVTTEIKAPVSISASTLAPYMHTCIVQTCAFFPTHWCNSKIILLFNCCPNIHRCLHCVGFCFGLRSPCCCFSCYQFFFQQSFLVSSTCELCFPSFNSICKTFVLYGLVFTSALQMLALHPFSVFLLQ